MTTLQFVDTHNLVAFLAKPAKSEGFKQVVDFLNASSIKYALTGNPTIYTSCIEQFWSTVKAKMVNREVQLQALMDIKKIVVTEASVRRDLQLEDANGIDCLPNAIIFEQLTLMGVWQILDVNQDLYKYFRNNNGRNINHQQNYIAPSHTKKVFANMKRQGKDFSSRVTPLFSTMMVQAQQEQGEEQDRGNISKTQSKATPDELSSFVTSSGGGPRRQDTMGYTIAQTRSENVSKFFNDPLLAGVNTPRSDISSKQTELKRSQHKQGRKIHDIDADKDITLENVHDVDMFGMHDLDGDEVFLETKEPVVNAAKTTSTISVSAAKDLSDVDMTLAQALAELKSTKPKAVTTAATTTTTAVTRPKAKGFVIQEQKQASTPITSSKDEGKGIMVEEPLKMKKKDQVLFDEQEAIRLQA
ncbi:hypothetical protein Tco_0105401 [Tanacetum coccineum]